MALQQPEHRQGQEVRIAAVHNHSAPGRRGLGRWELVHRVPAQVHRHFAAARIRAARSLVGRSSAAQRPDSVVVAEPAGNSVPRTVPPHPVARADRSRFAHRDFEHTELGRSR